MAYDDKTSALELHIRVNGQNLSANSEKCSANTLRLPNDPSWPKIPARRLINNNNDIKPPYVVTLTGTPRKGRSVIRTVTCQPAKSNQRCETHVSKRLPSFVDPRFKRQITRQEAEKPDESCLTKNGKQMPELDTGVSQEIKELDEAEKERVKIARDYALPHEVVDKDSESDTKPVRETSDYSVKEQCNLETHHCAALQHASNERQNPEDGLSHQQKQEANRLLLMIDEKAQMLPINALNVEPAPLPALYQPLANYSIQIPVVTYHNVPLQIPTMSTQVRDVRIPCECMKERRDSIGDLSTLAKEFEDNNSQQHKVKNSDETSETLIRENINANVLSLNRDNIDDNAIKNQHGNFNLMNNAKYNPYNLNTFARPEVLAGDVKNERVTNEFPTSTMSEKVLPNDVQYSDKVNENKECNNNEEPHQDVCVGLKRRKPNLSKRAKSFFRKKSRLAIADSDYTLVLPGPRVRSKQSYKICGRFKSGINSRSLTNVQDENTFETLSSIPFETQELLKESYWEYYRGLRRKIALSKSEVARRREKEPQECLPESRTLQQCSMLSCKINTTLQDPTIADGKLLSVSAANLLRKKRQRALKRTRLLILKTIAFLGITVSVAVIFLPMIYEYFFEEERDEDENLSYIELTMYYITSSFQEAFGGIFDMLNTFFLRPVRSHRKF